MLRKQGYARGDTLPKSVAFMSGLSSNGRGARKTDNVDTVIRAGNAAAGTDRDER